MRLLVLLLGASILAALLALWLRPERERSQTTPARPEETALPLAERAELVPTSALTAVPEGAAEPGAPGQRESSAARGALVAGRVEVGGGLPAGEEVAVIAHARRPGGSRHARVLEAPVARDGSFELRLPEDTRSVGLELDSLLLFLPQEVEVPPGTLDVVLRPELLAALRGRVHRPLGFDPPQRGEDPIHVSAGRASSVYADDGRFELVVEPDVPLELVARSESSGGLETRLEIDALRAGEIRSIEVFLEPLLALRGLVTDEADAPLEGVRVALFLPLGRRVLDGRPSAEDSTGADGSFVLDQLSPGPCDVEVSVPGRRSERRRLTLPDDGHHLLHFVLAPAVTVHGRVVGPDGAARSGAQIRELTASSRRIPLSRDEPEKPLQTDEEGRFSLVWDEPTLRLVAAAQGFADSLPLTLEAGTGAEESEVVLRLRQACSLRVRVSRDDGELVNGTVLFRSEDGTQRLLGVEGGTVEAHDLPPGKARIVASPYPLADSRLVSGTQYTGDVEVELTPDLQTHAELRLQRTK